MVAELAVCLVDNEGANRRFAESPSFLLLFFRAYDVDGADV